MDGDNVDESFTGQLITAADVPAALIVLGRVASVLIASRPAVGLATRSVSMTSRVR